MRTVISVTAVVGIAAVTYYLLLGRKPSSPPEPERRFAIRAAAAFPGPAKRDVASAPDVAQEKLAILESVLRAKNDNDPRLDIVFRDLTPETREKFREKYRALPTEQLNQRGTIVFLLGREIRSKEDVKFLGGVAREKPCLSLVDCGKTVATDPHAEGNGVEVTLSYLQLMAVRALETYLSRRDRDPEIAKTVRESLEAARKSPAPMAADLAKRALRQNPR